MSTYRSPPPPRKPTVVVMKRSYFSVFLWLLLVAFSALFVFMLFSRVTVTCSRADATCRVVVERGPGIVFRDETFPLASLERASVESHVDDEGDTMEGIALVRKGKAELLDGSSNIGHDGKMEWAETVNTFLHDSSTPHFELSRGFIWPGYVWAAICLLSFISVVRSRTQLVIDKDAGLLKVEERGLLRSTQTYPLVALTSADVHEQDSDGTAVRAVRLCFEDGTTKAITGYSNIEDGEKYRVVDAINEAVQAED